MILHHSNANTGNPRDVVARHIWQCGSGTAVFVMAHASHLLERPLAKHQQSVPSFFVGCILPWCCVSFTASPSRGGGGEGEIYNKTHLVVPPPLAIILFTGNPVSFYYQHSQYFYASIGFPA